MKNKFIYIFLLLLISCLAFSQNKKDKRKKIIGTQTSFGVHISPILPMSFIQNNNVIKTTDTSRYSVDNLLGYELGMEIRHSFTKRITLQTGINFIHRNFYATADLYNSSEHTEEQLKFIAYEIPVKLLGFVQISKNVFMDISGGLGIEMYPSNIYVNRFYGQRTSWIQAAVLTNIGWEYRNEINGIFYLGFSYKLHFSDMMHVIYSNKYGTRIDYVSVSGNYLSINLKYYFPQKK